MTSPAVAAEKLDRLLGKMHRLRHGGAMLMSVEVPAAGFHWSGLPTGLAGAPLYRIASGSKLFTAALVFMLVDKRVVTLDAPIHTIVPDDLSGIHTFKGVDYSKQITVRHLLANTSGLVDYGEEAPKGETPPMARLMQGEDFTFTFADVLSALRGPLAPHFVPGAPGRAHYSDSNFQLLERALEHLTGTPFPELVARAIVEPLGLRDTFVFTKSDIARYDQITPVYAGDRRLRLPNAMACFGAQGGVISSLADSQSFLQAFMQGRLFDPRHIMSGQEWNRIFFPFRYGLGVMRVSANPLLGVVGGKPHLIGHSGSSGVIMFHDPQSGAYICGTSNHMRPQGLPYRFLIPALMAVRGLGR